VPFELLEYLLVCFGEADSGRLEIVMDGGKRGQVVKVCADPACRIHHPDTPSSQQVERERTEERKRIEKEKLAITTRHRILATILQRVSAPLKKADLLAVAHYLIGHLSYSQVPALAKRHKVEAKKDSASAQELLAKQVTKYDECELCKLLLEISLLDSAYQRSTASRDDDLMDAAKRSQKTLKPIVASCPFAASVATRLCRQQVGCRWRARAGYSARGIGRNILHA
jgi:hypothetical protein